MNDLDDLLDVAADDMRRAVSRMELTARAVRSSRPSMPSAWRVGLVSTTALLLVGAIYVAQSREGSSGTVPTSSADSSDLSTLSALPAYAVLGGITSGQPVSMRGLVGGASDSSSIPAVDIWQHGDATLVVRTADRSSGPPTTESTSGSTPASSSSDPPWGLRDEVQIRGVPGALESLADDQHVAWILTGPGTRYSVVIGRGMTRDQFLTTVESLVAVNGVLEPPTGFTAVGRYPALPGPNVVVPFADVSYGVDAGPWVSSKMPPVGRTSVEGTTQFFVGRLDRIDGKDVLIVNDLDRTFATWVDPSGVEVTIIVLGEGHDMTALVESAQMLNPTQWHQMNQQLSRDIAEQMPEVGRATLDNVTLIRRQDAATQALCMIPDGGSEVCARHPRVPSNGPEFITAQTQLDGQWIIFGYRPLVVGEVGDNSMDTVTFTDPSGTTTRPVWVNEGNADWYVTRVPDSVNVLSTNLGMVAGGIVGDITRPVVTGVLW